MISHTQLARRFRGELSTKWSTQSPFQWGKVAAVGTASPKTLDVYIEGSTSLTTGLRYLESYASPAVNDVVLIARLQTNRAQAARVVLGELA